MQLLSLAELASVKLLKGYPPCWEHDRSSQISTLRLAKIDQFSNFLACELFAIVSCRSRGHNRDSRSLKLTPSKLTSDWLRSQ